MKSIVLKVGAKVIKRIVGCAHYKKKCLDISNKKYA